MMHLVYEPELKITFCANLCSCKKLVTITGLAEVVKGISKPEAKSEPLIR
jgi:hypothetical protein